MLHAIAKKIIIIIIIIIIISYTITLYLSSAVSTNFGIVLSSASGNVTLSSTMLLVCVAGGSSAPNITWQFQNGTLINNDTSIKVELLLALKVIKLLHSRKCGISDLYIKSI